MTLIAATAGAEIPDDVLAMRARGDYTAARARLAALADETREPAVRDELLFEAERLRRVMMDFNQSEEETLEEVREQIPDVTAADLARWREERWIQARVIDGEVRHFRRGVRNLLRHCTEARERRDAARGEVTEQTGESPRQSGLRKVDARELQRRHVAEVIEQGRASDSGLCAPTRHRVTYTLTVKPGQVPEGEIIRCWLLCPREEPHQTDFRLLGTEPAEHTLAPPDTPQRTVHMEQPSRGDEPTEFRVSYEYTAWAWYRDIEPDGIEPYDTDGQEYLRFTAEEPPHIVFTPEIRAAAREAVGDQDNPYLKAKQIFDWIEQNVRYISEREYSTILNASDLCLQRKAGDCGIQSLLFITMCRAAGVPARWESGWYVRPLSPNMHDWARFQVEPHGWIWADQSLGHHRDWETPEAQEFYFGNVDAFRLVANSAYSRPLVPPKRHFRSETIDFQRGEVEWEGGNLYFDQWEWDMDIEVVE
jgi:hypothetical protein